MEAEIKKMSKSLSDLKKQDLSNDKLNSLIDLSLKQNEILAVVHEMAKTTMERSLNTFKNIQVALEAQNTAFENLYKWKDAQEKYNDSVADKFSELIISTEQIKKD